MSKINAIDGFDLDILNESLTKNDYKEFLITLKSVIKNNYNIDKIAELTNINRTTMYRALSRNGNPSFKTIFKIMSVLKLDFKVIK